MFPDKLPSHALRLSLGMTQEQMAELAPSELEPLLEAAEEVNPTFAGLVKRLAEAGRKVIAAGAKRSDGQPAA